MGESIDVWREFFRTTDTNIFEFIDKAITIVALDCPKEFLERRCRIAELLFSFQTTEAGGDCTLKSKENKANGDNKGNAAQDVVSINCSNGEAGTFSDDVRETSQVVSEVLKIKRVLDNSRHESDSVLCESLRRLQSMTITVDILEKTKIGVSVNTLRKNSGSKQIAQLAYNITMGWKAMVEEICRCTVDVADTHKVEDGTSSIKDQNIRESRQEKYNFKEAGSPAQKNRRLTVNQHKGIVKPSMSSNTNSRTTSASKGVSWKFGKERMLQSQDSKESVVGCKRPLACGQDMMKCWNEVVADMKFAATKRKIHELYQKAESEKRQRTIQVLDQRDLPRKEVSHRVTSTKTKKACQQRVILPSRVSCV